MKKVKLLLLSVAMLSLPCAAQRLVSGNFTLPDDEKFFLVKFDFSQTVFEKKFNEKEWAAINGEAEWNAAKRETLALIVSEMNEKLKESRIYAVQETMELDIHYTLWIRPVWLDRKGNNTSYYVLTRQDADEELGVLKANGDGGHWGTLANLLGDGYEEAARKVGQYLRRRNR